MTLQDNVRKGATWLDGFAPGWESKIDLSTLDLHSSVRCVAGQALNTGDQSGYGVMMEALRGGSHVLGAITDVEYGFTHPDVAMRGPQNPYSGGSPSDPRLVELVRLWTAEIMIRRQTPEVTP